MKEKIFPCSNGQDAEFVILSSGLGGHATFWQPQIAPLTQYFHVLVYDQEGCHADSAHLPQYYSIQNMAEQALAILQKYKIDKCHFIGHALGAVIGAELAVLVQNTSISLLGLTMINAWDTLDPHTQKCFQTRIALLKDSGAEAYVRAQALFLYPPAFISKNHQEIQQIENIGLQDFPPSHNVMARLKALMEFEILPIHRKALLNTDLYYIANKDDFLVPYQKSHDLQAALGHGDLTVLDYGAHASTITDSKTLNYLLIKNLKG
ncbi:pyrimidine utilization protein D [Acinetobacter bereziniae]|uniref:pyrimidine utilization protein D n=1 Tax=Acinetobacter bereziniae TaxID=106648 RepID=UPI00124FBAFD|nr:pyrimidine utilization protein D [Acinetobacter bereziniae]